ncbi:MAG: hypothetical protein R3C15_05830 [Thermoleophilia bacterium]
MIPLDPVTGLPRAEGLPPGCVAYVDTASLEAGLAAVPALVAGADGSLAWHGGDAVASVGSSADERVARLLAALAARAAARVPAGEPGTVEVVGEGALAALVAARLGARVAAGGERPRTIVETSGSPAAIAAALARADDRAVVVLAGEDGGRAPEVDLYADVHLRGLELVGVAAPGPDEADEARAAGPELVSAALGLLVDAPAHAPGRPALLRVS